VVSPIRVALEPASRCATILAPDFCAIGEFIVASFPPPDCVQLADDVKRSRSGWLTAVHVDGDGFDGVLARRRASNATNQPRAAVD